MSGARHSAVVRPSAHPVSDAVLHLNRMGHVVDQYGCLVVDGQRVQLTIQGGRVVAQTAGVTMPFDLFAKCLRPVDRPSYPPRGVGRDGVPSWAGPGDILPDRKDRR